MPHPASAPGATLQRGSSVGRYLVLDKLGEGGMGLVYAAYDPELNRKVALKLLRPLLRGPSSPAQARLLREAQAMARVSHPNVISVFDVGTHGDQQVFVAMEFVDGGTLNDWLLKQKRTLREIIKLFIEAGRGLAAAHAAGLVHRDFKPENVLLGTDGRVRVTDFGLARLTTDEEQEHAEAQTQPQARPALGTRLTQAGAIVGTPLFMSPEQHRRQTPDARSDQFNFCASLYWAIYGSSPLQGLERIYLRQQPKDDDHTSTVDTVTSAQEDGPTLVKEFPKEPRIPASVRRALVRGLALDPDKRFASMEELLKKLSYDPAVTQRRWAIGAGLAMVVVTSGIAYSRAFTGNDQLCQGAQRELEKVWNAKVRGELSTAFATSGYDYAAELRPQVEQKLDAYAGEWVTMHRDACEATRLRGEQTEDVLSLRMICLDRRLLSLGALVNVLKSADKKAVEKSLDAALALPRMRGCADVEALKSPTPLPEDQATRTKVEEIQRTLAESKALMDSGNLPRAKALAESAAEAARKTGYAPIMAEAFSSYGWALDRNGEPKRAEELLREAAAAGEEGRLDHEKARALTKLVYTVGYSASNAQEAGEWRLLAEAAVKRVGSAELETDLLNYWGNVNLGKGKHLDAVESLSKAEALAEREFGEMDPRTNIIRSNLGSALQRVGKPEQALVELTRSVAALEKIRGPSNPVVANTRRILANVYLDLKDYKRAYDEIQKAIAIHTATLGAESSEVASDLDWLALTLQGDGLYAEALQEAERSLKIRRKALPADSVDLAYSLENIGQAYLGLRRPLDAIPNLEAALRLHESNGSEPAETAEARFALARALWDGNRDKKRAAALAEQALAGYRVKNDDDHVRLVTQWQQGHPAPAGPPPRAPLKGGSRR